MHQSTLIRKLIAVHSNKYRDIQINIALRLRHFRALSPYNERARTLERRSVETHSSGSVPPVLKVREFRAIPAPSRLYERMFELGCGYRMSCLAKRMF